MQQRNIIIFIIIVFIASSLWLFSVSDKSLDPNTDKNWWAIYFSDPKPENLDFVIENHSDTDHFRWIILEGRSPVKDDQITILKGEKQEINFDMPQNSQMKKYTVEVYQGEEKKEIYKNFDK